MDTNERRQFCFLATLLSSLKMTIICRNDKNAQAESNGHITSQRKQPERLWQNITLTAKETRTLKAIVAALWYRGRMYYLPYVRSFLNGWLKDTSSWCFPKTSSYFGMKERLMIHVSARSKPVRVLTRWLSVSLSWVAFSQQHKVHGIARMVEAMWLWQNGCCSILIVTAWFSLQCGKHSTFLKESFFYNSRTASWRQKWKKCVSNEKCQAPLFSASTFHDREQLFN